MRHLHAKLCVLYCFAILITINDCIMYQNATHEVIKSSHILSPAIDNLFLSSSSLGAFRVFGSLCWRWYDKFLHCNFVYLHCSLLEKFIVNMIHRHNLSLSFYFVSFSILFYSKHSNLHFVQKKLLINIPGLEKNKWKVNQIILNKILQ